MYTDSLADENIPFKLCNRLSQLIYFIMLTYHKFQILEALKQNLMMNVHVPGVWQTGGKLFRDGCEVIKLFFGNIGDT